MPRRKTPLDPAALLAALTSHQVDFVVIGGLAVQTHGHTRTTQDVDIVPALDRQNFARLAGALADIGSALPAGAPEVVSLETSVGGLDIHRDPPGAPPYAELRARALEVEVGGMLVAVASLDDLIAMKRASGRPIDRSDIAALTDPGG